MRRATGLIWSKNTYQLGQILEEPDNCVLYYLQDGPNRAFASKELVHISKDTQLSPERVSE